MASNVILLISLFVAVFIRNALCTLEAYPKMFETSKELEDVLTNLSNRRIIIRFTNGKMTDNHTAMSDFMDHQFGVPMVQSKPISYYNIKVDPENAYKTKEATDKYGVKSFPAIVTIVYGKVSEPLLWNEDNLNKEMEHVCSNDP